MRIIMMACTERGFALMRRAAASLSRCLPEAEIVQEGRCACVPGYEDGPRLSQSTEKWFSRAEALVFFSAAGIAVRCIAPFVKDKFTDPAVIVMDEGGHYCISLLSGHVGGANRLCRILAEATGAMPVITTATDTQKRFAVDVFAVDNGLSIHSREAAKKISAAVVAGETVKMYAEPECMGFFGTEKISGAGRNPFEAAEHPESGLAGVTLTSTREEADILLSFRKTNGDRPDALCLIPRMVTLGIGCRKGTETGRIREAAEELLQKNGVFREALCGIASIDLKKEEAGLLSFAEEWKLPLTFYTSEELQAVPGVFTTSEFVKKMTGADNVCERSAVLLGMEPARREMRAAQPEAEIILPDAHSKIPAISPDSSDALPVRILAGKFSQNGVTAALAVRKPNKKR